MVRRLFIRVANILPGKLKVKMVNFLERGMEALTQLKQSRTIVIMALYTVIILILSTLTNS